jgi:hypothetical protein
VREGQQGQQQGWQVSEVAVAAVAWCSRGFGFFLVGKLELGTSVCLAQKGCAPDCMHRMYFGSATAG